MQYESLACLVCGFYERTLKIINNQCLINTKTLITDSLIKYYTIQSPSDFNLDTKRMHYQDKKNHTLWLMVLFCKCTQMRMLAPLNAVYIVCFLCTRCDVMIDDSDFVVDVHQFVTDKPAQ